jgi:general nucleoside transport system permease protein
MEATSGLALGLLPAALRSATPLLFALLGETITQRAGIVNLGIEGQMLVGAATAFGVAARSGNPWLGLVSGALAGGALSLVHAVLCLRYRANQFASGLSVWMLGFGVSGYLGASLVGQSIAGFSPLSETFLGKLPLVGDLTPTVLLSFVAVVFAAGLLFATRFGLNLRAVGESLTAARVAGLPVDALQTAGIVLGGLLSGLGGAALAIDYADTWAEGMTRGRGLVAVGLVIVARWNPLLAFPVALLFGGAEALSLRVQTAGATTSAHLLHTLPYVVCLLVFVATCVSRRSAAAPAGLRAVLDH